MFVVTLPRSAAESPMHFAKRAKKAGAHVLEIRSDLTPNVQPFASPLPILVSIRGSRDVLTDSLRPAYVDIEEGADGVWVPSGAKLIVSLHDHDKTPTLASLLTSVRTMQRSNPWAIKIATFIRTERDLVTLTKLQEHLTRTGSRSIVLGMGPKAHLLRILSPLRNALTYATLDGADASAPGQLPLSLYALTTNRRNPKLLGILGGPSITASLSPVIHNALFSRHKVDALYSCFPSENFSSTMKALRELGVTGHSVTAPFKHDAWKIATKRDAVTKALGVANTLVHRKSGWHAWNTDGEGIAKGYPFLASVKSVIILGAGGVVPSVIRACREANASVGITVCARNIRKAQRELSGLSVTVLPLTRAKTLTADTVFCAVSKDVALPMPSPASHASHAIDLRYGRQTRFMKDARAKKFRVHDGTSMLIHQALKQFTHFTGKKPISTDVLYLRKLLTSFSASSAGR